MFQLLKKIIFLFTPTVCPFGAEMSVAELRQELKFCLLENHRHLKIIDCLTARVFFVSTVNGRSKKKEKKAALVAGT